MPFESTHLHYYLDLIRDESYHDSGYSLFNILNTWKSARNNKIINEDFSHIDFGYIPLNNIDFGDREHPSSFRGATLSDENYVSGHVGKILCSALWRCSCWARFWAMRPSAVLNAWNGWGSIASLKSFR